MSNLSAFEADKSDLSNDVIGVVFHPIRSRETADHGSTQNLSSCVALLKDDIMLSVNKYNDMILEDFSTIMCGLQITIDIYNMFSSSCGAI